jgi:hypothetical protein
MEAALRELVDQFDKAKIQTSQDLFRIKPDATLKTVHRVMKYVLKEVLQVEVQVARKPGFHIAKFPIETLHTQENLVCQGCESVPSEKSRILLLRYWDQDSEFKIS